jgi:Ran GTPase-activating protein (RanGAP) involved in mRNA processing and transport
MVVHQDRMRLYEDRLCHTILDPNHDGGEIVEDVDAVDGVPLLFIEDEKNELTGQDSEMQVSPHIVDEQDEEEAEESGELEDEVRVTRLGRRINRPARFRE